MQHAETYVDCHLFAGLLHILPVTLWPGIMVWQMMPEIWICMHAWLRPLPGGGGPHAGKNTWCVEGSKSTRFKVFRISTYTFSYTTQTTHQTGGRNGSVSNKMMVAIIYTRRVGHLFHLCPTLNVCLWSVVHDDVGCCTYAVAYLPYPFPFAYPQQHDATILLCENGSALQSIS